MIDIGSNLTHRKLNPDPTTLEALINNCRNHSLQAVIAIGTNITDSEASLNIARAFPGFIFATAGVHPHDAITVTKGDWKKLSTIISQPEVVAVGEMGLDFNRNFSPPDIQESVFIQQLELNRTIKKPLYLHERDALDRQIQILKDHRDCYSSGVAHCFTGTRGALKKYLDLDFYIGITGWICDERRGQDLAEAVNYIPQNRLVVETDSPFLLPRTLSPKPKDRNNRPWYVKEVIAKVAQCRDEQTEDIEHYTTQNAKTLFNLS